MSKNPGQLLKKVLDILEFVLISVVVVLAAALSINCLVEGLGTGPALLSILGGGAAAFGIWLICLIVECIADIADNIWNLRKMMEAEEE